MLILMFQQCPIYLNTLMKGYLSGIFIFSMFSIHFEDLYSFLFFFPLNFHIKSFKIISCLLQVDNVYKYPLLQPLLLQ